MNYVIQFLKGLTIGATMVVPGVSGGTMALILGIYDQLIHAISSFFKNVKENIIFLLVVGVGGIIGIAAISSFVEYSLEVFEYPMKFFFIGIVLGGIPILYEKTNVNNKKKTDWIFFVIGILIIGSLILLDRSIDGELLNLANSQNFLGAVFLFIAGIVISIGLILPGISTSFLLLTLGLYSPIIDAVKTMNIGFLAPILIGIAFGVITSTKILENFMQKKPRPTYLLIIGFVLASMIEVFPGIPTGMDIIYSILLFIVGFVIINFISKKYSV